MVVKEVSKLYELPEEYKQYQAFFDLWVKDGGIENNLRLALMGAKVIPVTAKDILDFAMQSMRQGAALLENMREQDERRQALFASVRMDPNAKAALDDLGRRGL